MAADTTTTLNPGVGGDSMDESLATQADGATQAKRARVDVGFGADDARGRLVSQRAPLPVDGGEMITLLRQIAEDIRVMRMIAEARAEQ